MKTITIELTQKVSFNLAGGGLSAFGGGFLKYGESRTAEVDDAEMLRVKRLAAKGLLSYKVEQNGNEKSYTGKARKGGK